MQKDSDLLTIIEYIDWQGQQALSQQGQTIEVHVTGAIAECRSTNRPLSIGNISKTLRSRYSNHYDRKITPHWIEHIVRSSLHLQTVKMNGVYILDPGQKNALVELSRRYDVEQCSGKSLEFLNLEKSVERRKDS